MVSIVDFITGTFLFFEKGTNGVKDETIVLGSRICILLSMKLMAVSYPHANQNHYEAKLINCYRLYFFGSCLLVLSGTS